MKLGTVGWIDLSVDDASGLRDFYASVIGWQVQEVEMGDYSDYAMATPDGDGVCGVCHKRGENAYIPSVWMPYFMVADLDDSLAKAVAMGGEQIGPIREMGGKMCIVRDPAGVHFALFQA